MTKSVRSVNILVRLDFQGNDVCDKSIEDAINNMGYNFEYSDDYVTIMGSEIVESFVERS